MLYKVPEIVARNRIKKDKNVRHTRGRLPSEKAHKLE